MNFNATTTQDRADAMRIEMPRFGSTDEMNRLRRAAIAATGECASANYARALVLGMAIAVRKARRASETTGQFDAALPEALRAAAVDLDRMAAGAKPLAA